MRDEVYVGVLFSDNYLAHYGKGHDDSPPGRGSGRYPWGSGKRPKQSEQYEIYDRPYSYQEIVKNYGKKLADNLMKDPAHKFRANTGIELIHREPSLSELKRIWKNWNLMSDEMKSLSDEKSRELFGLSNKENYERLLMLYTVK